jgi:hypothetical protein
MAPRTLAVLFTADHAADQFGILLDVEVEHSDRDEISTVLEGVRESLLGIESACGQYFECQPGFRDRLHEIDGFFRIDAPHVVVPAGAPVQPDEFLALCLGVADG